MIFVILPVVGGLIGWLTNYLAIRMLFRPLEPVKLPFFNVYLQGLIPKRRGNIAEKIGQVVAEQLVPMDEMWEMVDMPRMQKEADRLTREIVGNWCEERLGILPGRIKRYCSNYLRESVAQEVSANFPEITRKLLAKVNDQVNIRRLVEEKINNLPLPDVEKLVLEVARRELKQIEWLGGFLGFFIGFLQACFLYLAGRT